MKQRQSKLFFVAAVVANCFVNGASINNFVTSTSGNVIVNDNSISHSVSGTQGAVSAVNEQCSNAGVDVLKEGGSAVDAAIASNLCISVINTVDVGVGGGGFMLIRSPRGDYDFIDFRETAPAAATEDMYVKDGNLARVGGLAVGVPGVVRGMELAHSKYGVLPWKRLFKDAIRLSGDGFIANEYITERIGYEQSWMKDLPEFTEIYAPNGTFVKPGEIIKNVALSKTLQTIATKGADSFYKGPIAESLIETIQKNGGIMTLKDMSNYRAVHRPVVNTTYHGNRVFSASAPTSGPILLNVLNLIEAYNFTEVSALNYHRFTEALKFGYSARAEIGDPGFIKNQERLDEIITKEWADTVRPYITDNTTHNVSYYNAKYEDNQPHGTMHLSVLDKQQSAVSLTSTVNLAFGSRVLDRKTGIILNSQQDDFSSPGVINAFGYSPSPNNYVAPGKRPLSSTVPTIIEDSNGQVKMVVGASGGSFIITGTLNTIVNTLNYKRNLFDAVGAPRLHHQLMPHRVDLEIGFDSKIAQHLANLGHNVTYLNERKLGYSAVQAIYRHENGTIDAVSDPRKFGLSAAYSKA